MFYRSKIRRISIALALTTVLIFNGILLPATVSVVFAQDSAIDLTASGPSYGTPGSNITYELTLKNPTSQVVTDIMVWNPLPVNTTTVHRLSLQCDGTTITPAWDGATLGSTQDGTYKSGMAAIGVVGVLIDIALRRLQQSIETRRGL